MKASELTKLAKKSGRHIKRHGADHDIWINPQTGSMAPIPRHRSKEVPTGTVNRIKKDSGLE